MRVAVNLNMFHPELPLLQRYKAAATAGFRLVEVSLPYSEKAEVLKSTADSLGLAHSLINAPPGDWSRGFRGLAALPTCKAEFRESIDTAVHYAKTLNCDKVHVMAGIPAKGESDSHKPINHYTVPGYFLSSYEQAKNVIDEVKSPNLKIQYDVFHAQQICGQISATIKKYKDLIGYIQVAQVPSRDEPHTAGEIDYKYVFGELKTANPNWTIGLEHNFHEANGAPLDWVQKLGLSM
ncbi:unnamed protein product [Heligmosomoides polygyrus]|uniref:Putative hydroxypyruvate isomerase n=1 Tax=Heligmosomoides polygyrus TaxID=6339 RepID=A0A3P7WH29_HELPZ|nr:unnamed protein product [Heligmosomoides polygyrus]